MTETARSAALFLLAGVLRKNRPLDDLLAEQSANGVLTSLSARDRAFARALTATCLRRLGECDAFVAKALDRSLPKKAGRVMDLLRLGITQIVWMDMPPHAAVNETVKMAGRSPQSQKFKNVVNALLRKAAREAEALRQNRKAAELNTPGWLWESWNSSYGLSAARAIAEQHLIEPSLDLTVKSTPEDWAERLEGTTLPMGTIRRAIGDVTSLDGFGGGEWWVQDAAAALPVHLLGDISGKHVIDLCAAPGGKTLQLAAKGASVTAVDRSDTRLGRVRSNLTRTKLTAELVAADAVKWRPDEPANAVLLDAPCSATGTIRRHPDVARLKSPEDVAKLAKTQSRLLDAAAKMVKPGGVIVYCTCSLQPEEGEAQITAFLERTPDFELARVTPEDLPGLADAVTMDGHMRTLPCTLTELGGMDGFFAARVKRKG